MFQVWFNNRTAVFFISFQQAGEPSNKESSADTMAEASQKEKKVAGPPAKDAPEKDQENEPEVAKEKPDEAKVQESRKKETEGESSTAEESSSPEKRIEPSTARLEPPPGGPVTTRQTRSRSRRKPARPKCSSGGDDQVSVT